ncbi:SET domain-containing protein [Rhodotorula paludigena]|uniref:SET domain-containing protein n=1 Tax=Rhodotorula paludigena TaxID=86838 RepID=UPI003174DE53
MASEEPLSSALAPSDRPFAIGATPSGFLGAFATRDIPRGELVLHDAPLFTVDAPLQAYLFQRVQSGSGGGPTPVEGEEDEEPAKDLDEFLDRNIRTMLSWKTEQQRKDFWDLANTRPDLPPAYGIFATNAVQTSGEIGGMFLLLSRFNSSCRPTLSRPAWNPSTGSTRLYALRDIKAGEELTWTYLNVTFEFEGVEARRDEMRRVFEFECCCPACGPQVGDGERAKSERRLLQLRRLKERMGGDEDAQEDEARRETLRRMALLSREEGLWETADRLEKALEA